MASKKKTVKATKKKSRKCSDCGALGHNARSHQSGSKLGLS